MADGLELLSLTVPHSADVTDGTTSLPISFVVNDTNLQYPGSTSQQIDHVDQITISLSQPIEYEVPSSQVIGAQHLPVPGYAAIGNDIQANLGDERYSYSPHTFFNYSTPGVPLAPGEAQFNFLLGSQTAAGIYEISSVAIQDYAGRVTTYGADQLDALGVNRFITVASNATVTTLCFCRGTRIATPEGERAVEGLRVGDTVLTIRGQSRPIRWIGKTDAIVGAGHGPILIRQGAFGHQVPERDLRVTDGHSFLFGDVLIPIGLLQNGSSIQRLQAGRMELYHIELDVHDVLIAEGAAAESYRDDGNRSGFTSQVGDIITARSMATCAPVISRGPIVHRTRAHLAERAATCLVGVSHPPFAAVNS